MDDDKEWLTFVRNKSTENVKNVFRAVLHATDTERSPVCGDLSPLLPTWRQSSKSPTVTKHSMMIMEKAIESFNPGQTPVIMFDQPLHAISKQLQ